MSRDSYSAGGHVKVEKWLENRKTGITRDHHFLF
jgi:hypothetical protein